MSQEGAGTHEQRRRARRIKRQWTDLIVSGQKTIHDLVEATREESEDSRYLMSILLVDLLLEVHPGLGRSHIISELDTLGIKAPKDPARYSVRSIRLRPDLVDQVDAMLRASAMTKTVRARAEMPTNWPWMTKLSDLVRLTGGEMPQGLDWLESGTADEVVIADLLVTGPGLDHAFEASEVEVAPAPQREDGSEPSIEPESEAAESPPDEAPATPLQPEVDGDPNAEPEPVGVDADDPDPFSLIEAAFDLEDPKAGGEAEDPLALAFGDIVDAKIT